MCRGMYKRKSSFYLIVYTSAEGVRRRKYCFSIKQVVKKRTYLHK